MRHVFAANPLRQNISSSGEVNGALYNADFLTPDDFTRTATRLNNGSQRANLVAKIDVATNETTNLTLGLTAAGDRSNNFSYARSLMNWENNDLETGLDWRGYVKFSQRFVDEEGEEGAGGLKNVFTPSWQTIRNPTHASRTRTMAMTSSSMDMSERLTLQTNSYQYDEASGRHIHNGWQDTLVTFEESPFNPELAAINQYFSLFDNTGGNAFGVGPGGDFTVVSEVHTPAFLRFKTETPSSMAKALRAPMDCGATLATKGHLQHQQQHAISRVPLVLVTSATTPCKWLRIRTTARQLFRIEPRWIVDIGAIGHQPHIKEIDTSDSTVTNIGTDYYVT